MMKTNLFILITFLYPLLGNSQPIEDRVVLSGEIMFGNSIQEAKKIPFQEAFKVILSYQYKGGQDVINLEVDELMKKEWYDYPGGTKIRFYMPKELYKKLSEGANTSFILYAKFLYKLPVSGKIDTVDRSLTISVNRSNSASKVMNSTIELNPILLGEPERLTLTLMTNFIKSNLESSSANQDGFSNIIHKLNKYVENSNRDKNIDFETLIEFYRFFVFTEEYVGEEKSKTSTFFNKEALNLNLQITMLNNQLSDTTLYKQGKIQHQKLINDLIASNEVYQQYQKYYAMLKEYNAQLKLMLFFRTN